jgi:2'-5' RNA ligase
MRIFAALELPRDALESIERWQRPLIESHPSLKWVEPHLMHMTLRFFGNVDQGTLDRIRSVMYRWRPGPLSFVISRLGTFGRRGETSVYWLGGEFPPEVQEVALILGNIPDEKGRISRREFKPHLTVARRRHGDCPVLEAPEVIRGTVLKSVVINSTLTPKGPRYSILERYDLTKPER